MIYEGFGTDSRMLSNSQIQQRHENQSNQLEEREARILMFNMDKHLKKMEDIKEK